MMFNLQVHQHQIYNKINKFSKLFNQIHYNHMKLVWNHHLVVLK